MRTDEAINRMEIFVKDASEVAPELLDDAIKLGIEALKQVRQIRVYAKKLYLPLLPGETDE